MGFLWPDSPVGLALQVWGMVVARARTGQIPGKEPSSSRHGGAPALSRAWGRMGLGLCTWSHISAPRPCAQEAAGGWGGRCLSCGPLSEGPLA